MGMAVIGERQNAMALIINIPGLDWHRLLWPALPVARRCRNQKKQRLGTDKYITGEHLPATLARSGRTAQTERHPGSAWGGPDEMLPGGTAQETAGL